MRTITLLSAVVFFAQVSFAQEFKPDTSMTRRIREEGLNHSQVMDIAFYLTDASGPRLEGSPGFFRAANWAKNKLSSWGFENASLEPWGDWGKELGITEILPCPHRAVL
jgi:carboxypeptidase Q